jgi:anthranilate phosphoribosyltransferase
MLNPAQASYGLIGVYSNSIAPLMGGALQRLGMQRALVVHSFGLDELTPLGASDVLEVQRTRKLEFNHVAANVLMSMRLANHG